MRHKPIPKKVREAVHAKYGGRCAYCGCEIGYEEMQVDHVRSLYANSIDTRSENPNDNQDDSMENLMPSCRQCNFYKSSGDIEDFRSKIRDILDRTCRDSFQVRLAIKHGILEYKGWDGKFHFERVDGKA